MQLPDSATSPPLATVRGPLTVLAALKTAPLPTVTAPPKIPLPPALPPRITPPLILPLFVRVPPAATLTPPLPVPEPPVLPTTSVPLLTVVPPPYVFAPRRTMGPVPLSVWLTVALPEAETGA